MLRRPIRPPDGAELLPGRAPPAAAGRRRRRRLPRGAHAGTGRTRGQQPRRVPGGRPLGGGVAAGAAAAVCRGGAAARLPRADRRRLRPRRRRVRLRRAGLRRRRVFTANESPPDQCIPFHHEMAQAPTFPSKLFFFCEVEAKSGGETPIVLSHYVYKKVKEKFPEFVDKLEKDGLIYTRVLGEGDDSSSPIGRGWQSVFGTCDKVVAAESVQGASFSLVRARRHCKFLLRSSCMPAYIRDLTLVQDRCRTPLRPFFHPAQRYRKLVQDPVRAAVRGMKLEWIGDRVKTVTGPIPAVKWDKRRGRKLWFLNLVAAYTGWKDTQNGPVNTVTFGDGSPLPADILGECEKILEEESVAIPWQQGDILLIDNWAVLHGRRSSKSPRRILASLCK